MNYFIRCVYTVIIVCVALTVQNVNAGSISESFETGFGSFSLGGDYNFLRRSGSTSSYGTGPTGGANNSTYYIFLETSSGHAYYQGKTAYLTASNVSGDELTFYYHMYGSDIGTLRVRVFNGNAWYTTWEAVGQQQTSSGAEWYQGYVDLSEYGNNLTVRFEAIAAGGYRGDIALDDISITSFADESVYYEYDTLGRAIKVVDAQNENRNYTYDAAGNRKDVTIGDTGSGGGGSGASPTANDDFMSVLGTFNPNTVNVLTNDVDPSGNGLTISNITYNSGKLNVTNLGNGILQVTALQNFFETSISYTITNSSGNTDTAAVTVFQQSGSGVIE